MIGQHKNMMVLEKWKRNNSTPRFIIIEGPQLSGRLTLAKEILDNLENIDGTMGGIPTGIIYQNSIDDVRKSIEDAYTMKQNTVHIFRDVDDMSTGAKNAMLKVVEEPPKNSYFIMTLQNSDRALSTIKSRATVIKMEPYSLDELKLIHDDEKMLKYLDSPGLLLKYSKNEVEKAEQLSDDIIKAIKNKTGTQLLKLCTNLIDERKEVAENDKNCVSIDLFRRVLGIKSKNVLPIIYHYLPILDVELENKSINKKSAMEAMLLRAFKDYNETTRNLES